MVTIKILKTATAAACKDVNRLTSQLSKNAHPLNIKDFRAIVGDKRNVVVIAEDKGNIMGMGMLMLLRMPVGLRARVEGVVVDESHRGEGIGTLIMKKIIAVAKEKKIGIIELTSGKQREAANKLYKELGFEKHDTNSYKMKL
jgi:ribosomal protein S18 acetylase RimI-like enzyme